MGLSLLKKNKGLLVFTISSLAYSAMQMLFGLVVLKWISPAEMGLWNGVTIASPYISFLQLGVFVALNRELPFLIGKGDNQKAMNHVKTVASYANLISIIVLILTGCVLLYSYFNNGNSLYLYILIAFGLNVVLKTQQNYLVVTFRSGEDFRKLGFIYLGIIPIYILSILLVYYYEFYGFLWFQVLTPMILVCLLYNYRPFKVKPEFFKTNFRELLKTGIPFFSINYFSTISTSFKKIIILKYLGSVALGLFSPALAVLLIGRMLPKILGSFVYPKMSKKFGATGSRKDVWKININATIFTTLLAIPVAILLYFILPLLFEYVFDAYDEAYKSTAIIIASIVLIIPQMAYNGLNSVKAYKSMIVVTVLKLIIYWFGILVVYEKIGGLEGIAWGIVASDFLYSIVVLIACYYELNLKTEKIDK